MSSHICLIYCSTPLSQTSNHEGEMQIMLRIHREWASAAAAAASESAASSIAGVKFADIKATILKSNAQCKESILSMYKFVLKCCGGHDFVFIREDVAYVNSQTSSDRNLPLDLYDVFTDDLRTGSDQCQRFEHALLRLCLTCNLKVVNGDFKFTIAFDANKFNPNMSWPKSSQQTSLRRELDTASPRAELT